MKVYDQLIYKACGRVEEYKHKGKENKQTTRLQNFLDKVNEDREKQKKTILFLKRKKYLKETSKT